MKKTGNIKRARFAMIVTSATLIIMVIGVIANFIRTGMWDGASCSALACNTVVCSYALQRYKNAKGE